MITLLIVMTGLMAGIYFAFSIFIMKSFAELPLLQAAQAMNKINDVITKTLFLPVFFISTLGYAGLMLWSLLDWQQGSSWLMVVAALVYIVGMFAVTAFGNVPLNNHLKQSEVSETALTSYWKIYLRKWPRLNHWRTVSCTVACALLILAEA